MGRSRGLQSVVSNRVRRPITCQPTIRTEKKTLVRAPNDRLQLLERRNAVGPDALGSYRYGTLTETERRVLFSKLVFNRYKFRQRNGNVILTDRSIRRPCSSTHVHERPLRLIGSGWHR
ncbi:hypothetical protein NJ7G_3677 [Natrinema sp. J7-2]|nr:hypothetical protein NJ7G_3677 [Natrinema sp. J7-2]